MPKKILFISYDGMTDPLGQSQVLPYMQGLSKNDYEIFILSCEKEHAFAQHKSVVEALIENHSIHWVPIPYTKRPPVFSTIWDILQLKKAAKKIHKANCIDMVHTRPGIPALVGLWMKQTMGVKFLHDVREFYADSRIDGNIWKLHNPLYKKIYTYFKKKEAAQIFNCDGLVCLTHAAKRIILNDVALNKNTPISVIPCSADLELFNPEVINAAEKKLLQKELNIADDDFIISYLGSIGGWYLTKEMMQFCKLLSDKIPKAKFLFISPHLHEVIETEAAKYGLAASKLIIKKSTRKEIPLLLSFSKYSLFFIKPCYSKLSSSPTKHGELMAMGIPVITNSGVGDVHEIVTQYKGGFVIDNFSTASFTAVIDEIIACKTFDATQIRTGAFDFYSLEKAVELYTKLYKDILK